MNECVSETKKNGGFYCEAMDYQTCKGNECAFRTTKKEAEASRKKVNARLNALELVEQLNISMHYYKSKMPWKK